MNRAVFLDTVGLLGLWNHRDQWHVAAKWPFDELVAAEVRLLTTPLVLLECGNAAARHSFRHLSQSRVPNLVLIHHGTRKKRMEWLTS